MRVVGSRGTNYFPTNVELSIVPWVSSSFKLDASTSQALAEFHEEGGVEARKARYQVPWGPCEKVGDVLGCVELVILWKMMEIM